MKYILSALTLLSFLAIYLLPVGTQALSSTEILGLDVKGAGNKRVTHYYANDTETRSITLQKDARTLYIKAKGDQCQGAPNMVVKLNGQLIMEQAVKNKSWKTYKKEVNLAKGTHALDISFSNDLYRPDIKKKGKPCDRNLYVNTVQAKGKIKMSTELTATPKQVNPKSDFQPKYTMIFEGFSQIGWMPDKVIRATYKQWQANRTVNPAIRAVSQNKDDMLMQGWEKDGYNYYWTIASSDFDSKCKNIYLNNISDIDEVTKRPNNKGIYVHELAACIASKNNWKWSKATSDINWQYMNQAAAYANNNNKKLIWSEPAEGWNALYDTPAAKTFMAQWHNTVIPMYANNFQNNIPQAKAGAKKTASTYNTPLGASIQSWYFVHSGTPITPTAAKAQLIEAQQLGATYYQIEGRQDGVVMTLDQNNKLQSPPYMQGVHEFVKELK
jgi:Ca-dependent carbohydrate-binding module xylan-binding